jgi:prepilin-type N-terminal cleavage/methylation domain-containing protein
MRDSSQYRATYKLAYNHASARPPRRGEGIRGRPEVDERGFTIIELLLSVLVLSIIIGLSTSTVRMFYTQSADVQNTFAVTNQVLLASEILTEYTHDGVASCPAPTATPGDAACTTANGENPFAIATSTSATFFADTNDAGGTNGPVKLVVTLTGTTLTVTEAQPNASTCPLTSSPSTVCTYGTARTIATVLNETNATPLSYLIGTGSPPVPQGGSCSNASILNPATTGSPTQISEIVGMCFDLAAQLKGGQQAGYQSLAYMLSPGYTQNAG